MGDGVAYRIPSIKILVIDIACDDADIFDDLRFDFLCQFDVKDAIGRRYRRQDAIGTPYCITVDHQTLDDDTVTLRERDSMQQERVSIDQLPQILSERCSLSSLLRQL